MNLPAQEPWTCPNCHVEIPTPFCPACGERPLRPLDLTLRSLLAKLVHVLTSIDGRLLRTLGVLLRHPGQLTEAFVAGRRKPYIAPFQLFLLANVLFFAIQSLTGMNVFGAKLDSQLHQQDWSAFAQSLVEERLAASGTTLAAYAQVFDRAVVVNAKSLIILMAMPFAAVCALAFFGSRKPFIAHVAFSLHLYTLLLLLFSVAILGVEVTQKLGGPGLEVPRVDNLISICLLAAFAAYLYVAAGRYFGARGVPRALKVAALTLCAGALVLGYRFALFLITLYATT
jgi:hypothetical protein